VRDVTTCSAGLQRCDDTTVTFLDLPYYVGPLGFLRKRNAIRAIGIGALKKRRSAILRVPSPIASCVTGYLREQRKPYAVEVIGDPHDVMSAGALAHPLRPILRRMLTGQLRKDCASANAAAYVTEYTLQRRYPCGGHSISVSDVQLADTDAAPDAADVFTTHYSSVTLTECLQRPRVDSAISRSAIKVVTVGTLAQMYKGVDVLIDAVADCVQDGVDVSLTVIGDGRYRPDLEARAASRCLQGRIRFTGQLNRDQVTAELDAADLFALPSRCEGLPRALIEAMARGLPCIASNVGGIPELLLAEDLVAAGDVNQLAAAISSVARNVDRRNAMSRRNLARAHDYLEVKLRPRRLAFYRYVRAATEAWSTGIGPL
jgi:glycosyltransferase involved in cell wall biosynthesis